MKLHTTGLFCSSDCISGFVVFVQYKGSNAININEHFMRMLPPMFFNLIAFRSQVKTKYRILTCVTSLLSRIQNNTVMSQASQTPAFQTSRVDQLMNSMDVVC